MNMYKRNRASGNSGEKIGSCELRIRGVENENNNYIY